MLAGGRDVSPGEVEEALAGATMNEGTAEVGVTATTLLDADGDLEARPAFERGSTDDVVAPGL